MAEFPSLIGTPLLSVRKEPGRVRSLASAPHELPTDRPAPASGAPATGPKRLDPDLRALSEQALGRRPPAAADVAAALDRLLRKP